MTPLTVPVVRRIVTVVLFRTGKNRRTARDSGANGI